jgi:hypothetical protein
VLQFGFSEKVHGDKVGESERIESNVTGVSRKISRVFEERKSRTGCVSRSGNFFDFFRSDICSDNSGDSS